MTVLSNKTSIDLNKRRLLKIAASTFCACQFPHAFSMPTQSKISKIIPCSGELIPAMSMGTWQAFNAGNNRALREDRCKVLAIFLKMVAV